MNYTNVDKESVNNHFLNNIWIALLSGLNASALINILSSFDGSKLSIFVVLVSTMATLSIIYYGKLKSRVHIEMEKEIFKEKPTDEADKDLLINKLLSKFRYKTFNRIVIVIMSTVAFLSLLTFSYTTTYTKQNSQMKFIQTVEDQNKNIVELIDNNINSTIQNDELNKILTKISNDQEKLEKKIDSINNKIKQ